MTDQETPVWEDAGFEYDEGDPTVGIYGGWLHFCTATVVIDNDPSLDISEEWEFLNFEGEGASRYGVGNRVLVCNACGANVKWPEKDWDPVYPMPEDELSPEYIAEVREWAEQQEPTVL